MRQAQLQQRAVQSRVFGDHRARRRRRAAQARRRARDGAGRAAGADRRRARPAATSCARRSSDREVVQLKLGDPAEIRMDAYPSQAIAGTLTEIAGAADERSGMFPIEVRFDSRAGVARQRARREAQPASVRLARQQLTYVPIGAVVEGRRRPRQRVRRERRSREAPARARRVHRAARASRSPKACSPASRSSRMARSTCRTTSASRSCSEATRVVGSVDVGDRAERSRRGVSCRCSNSRSAAIRSR